MLKSENIFTVKSLKINILVAFALDICRFRHKLCRINIVPVPYDLSFEKFYLEYFRRSLKAYNFSALVNYQSIRRPRIPGSSDSQGRRLRTPSTSRSGSLTHCNHLPDAEHTIVDFPKFLPILENLRDDKFLVTASKMILNFSRFKTVLLLY